MKLYIRGETTPVAIVHKVYKEHALIHRHVERDSCDRGCLGKFMAKGQMLLKYSKYVTLLSKRSS